MAARKTTSKETTTGEAPVAKDEVLAEKPGADTTLEERAELIKDPVLESPSTPMTTKTGPGFYSQVPATGGVSGHLKGLQQTSQYEKAREEPAANVPEYMRLLLQKRQFDESDDKSVGILQALANPNPDAVAAEKAGAPVPFEPAVERPVVPPGYLVHQQDRVKDVDDANSIMNEHEPEIEAPPSSDS